MEQPKRAKSTGDTSEQSEIKCEDWVIKKIITKNL